MPTPTPNERRLIYTTVDSLLPEKDGNPVDSRAVMRKALSALAPIPSANYHHVIGVFSALKRNQRAAFEVVSPGEKTFISRL